MDDRSCEVFHRAHWGLDVLAVALAAATVAIVHLPMSLTLPSLRFGITQFLEHKCIIEHLFGYVLVDRGNIEQYQVLFLLLLLHWLFLDHGNNFFHLLF